MRRTAYIAAFILLAGVAAVLTLRAQRTVAVVVATHDVRAGTAVQSSDVEIRRLHDDSVPDGALSSTDAAVGKYATWPLTGGEPVLGRELSARASGAAVTGGLSLPPGYVAVAVPVQPAGAVGGMLAPGDRVDVYATALPGHALVAVQPAGDGAGAPASAGIGGGMEAITVGRGVLVLELRTDDGRALDQASSATVHGLNFATGKLGSIVLAVPEAAVPAYVTAAGNDAIYLALSVG